MIKKNNLKEMSGNKNRVPRSRNSVGKSHLILSTATDHAIHGVEFVGLDLLLSHLTEIDHLINPEVHISRYQVT